MQAILFCNSESLVNPNSKSQGIISLDDFVHFSTRLLLRHTHLINKKLRNSGFWMMPLSVLKGDQNSSDTTKKQLSDVL